MRREVIIEDSLKFCVEVSVSDLPKPSDWACQLCWC